MRTVTAILFAAAAALSACATAPLPLDETQLAAEMQRRPIVLLGEVHDNSMQHRFRQRALERLLQSGARPALAFEQFDHERQADLDRARRETSSGRTRAQHLIDAARTPGDQWNWDDYRPFIDLALQYELPIVAANLSRATASRIVRGGYADGFPEDQLRTLGLDRVAPDLLSQHQRIADEAHCHLLPAAGLPGMARAQIARDAVLARSIRPYFAQGVVLLTGNGHARRDVGVPRHLSESERGRTWAIAMLEAGKEDGAGAYDVAFVSEPHPREDPCRFVVPARR